MPFPFSRCLKTTPTEEKLPINAQLFNIRRDFGINAFEHRKLYHCASYEHMQDNIFATTKGVLCPPTQNNFSKEHVSDKRHHFFQMTLPGLQRKTHTMLTSLFFCLTAFHSKLHKAWSYLFLNLTRKRQELQLDDSNRPVWFWKRL